MPPANLSYIEPQGRERRLCGGIRGRGKRVGWRGETPPPSGCHGGVMDGRPDLGLTEHLASQAAPVGDGVSGNMPSGIDMKDAKRQSLAVRGIQAPKRVLKKCRRHRLPGRKAGNSSPCARPARSGRGHRPGHAPRAQHARRVGRWPALRLRDRSCTTVAPNRAAKHAAFPCARGTVTSFSGSARFSRPTGAGGMLFQRPARPDRQMDIKQFGT
jgi:hypothetical protein